MEGWLGGWLVGRVGAVGWKAGRLGSGWKKESLGKVEWMGMDGGEEEEEADWGEGGCKWTER